MKSIFLATSIVIVFLIGSCQTQKDSSMNDHDGTVKTEAATRDTIKKSIPKEEHAQVAGAHLTIKYYAPAVRGRTIWGGLVPYNEVWVTGAHSATSLEIDKDFAVNGRKISAGKYAIFTIPGREKWIIVINKNWDQHLADEYDAKDDVIRLEVNPDPLENTLERLQYSLTSKGDHSASISISWDKLRVTIPVEIK